MTDTLVLLDRDGTIIVDRRYLADPDGVLLERGAVSGLRKLVAAGATLAVITNQSGVGRGLFDVSAVAAVNDKVVKILEGEGVTFAGWYVCPHAPDENCSCRKPAPGLAVQAAMELGFALGDSFVVGDKLSDVDLALAVGATGILVETGEGAAVANDARARGVVVVADLDAAADVIIDRIDAGRSGDV